MPVAIRPAVPEDAEAITRVHGDTWRAAYRGIVPDAVLDGWGREPGAVERRRKAIGKPDRTSLVAVEGGEVVGFAQAGPAREGPPGFDTELYAIYVLPASQGRGAGRLLVRAAAGAVAAAGARSLCLWVLRDNARGRAFYERLGGRPAGEKDIEIGGAVLREVAYVWPDVRALLVPAGTVTPP